MSVSSKVTFQCHPKSKAIMQNERDCMLQSMNKCNYICSKNHFPFVFKYVLCILFCTLILLMIWSKKEALSLELAEIFPIY